MNTYLDTPFFDLVGKIVKSRVTGRKGEILKTTKDKIKVSWTAESDGTKICKWVDGKITESPFVSWITIENGQIF